MHFKRVAKSFIAIISIAFVVLAITSTFTKTKISISFLGATVKHSLTGLASADAPVYVVKIDDTTFAHPQVGLKAADVVYIEQVEGGLTRLAAVFSSSIPAIVGPVRSARISDIDLLAQYGKVGFSYSGVQRKMIPVVASANLLDLGATKYGPNFYQNDPARTAPYAMMLKFPELVAESRKRGAQPASSTSMGWKFGDPSEKRVPVSSVHISWPASSYDATWSPSEKRWLLTHNGNIDLDGEGFNLGPKTFVIQLVSITDSIYHDKVGGITPYSATVGSGQCFLLRDGGYLPCNWNRPTAESGTTFTDLAGNEIYFDRGQVWFALTAKAPVFKP
jgi:hypothetical protein